MNKLPVSFKNIVAFKSATKLKVLLFVLFLCTAFNAVTQNAPSADIAKFSIAENIKTQYPDLVQLILITVSMDDEERQYWFDLLPSMNDTQISRLFNILETERVKLEEIELTYQREIMELNQKHLDATKTSQNTKNDPEDIDEDLDPEKILEMLNNL